MTHAIAKREGEGGWAMWYFKAVARELLLQLQRLLSETLTLHSFGSKSNILDIPLMLSLGSR